MRKPKLDAARMQNELSASAFFRSPSASKQVNMSTSKHDDMSINQHVDKPPSQDVNKSTSKLVGKSVSQQATQSTNQHVSTLTLAQTDRFTTYVRPATIKAVKLLALESDRDVYEVVQDALDSYLRKARFNRT